jgi:Uma2 family endonuclease
MAVQKKLYTVAEFERFVELPENRNRLFEFIDGDIIEVPSNAYSSEIAAQFIRFLGNFVYPRRLGHVTGEHGGYIVAGARLAPDAAYISKTRQAVLAKQGYNPVAPDLAVEVISPTDNADEIDKKRQKYLAAGVLLWRVFPEQQIVEVHAAGQPVRTLGIEDTLNGGAVLPGFSLPVRDVFAE